MLFTFDSIVIFYLTCASVLSVLFLILFPIDRMVVEFIRIEVFLVISVHDAVPHPLSYCRKILI
ncbi:hypothetical protein T06_7589 [Trichinella sp. T6]|nr:hypothetical protein T06_7589 [Trichinella sp. T6]